MRNFGNVSFDSHMLPTTRNNYKQIIDKGIFVSLIQLSILIELNNSDITLP